MAEIRRKLLQDDEFSQDDSQKAKKKTKRRKTDDGSSKESTDSSKGNCLDQIRSPSEMTVYVRALNKNVLTWESPVGESLSSSNILEHNNSDSE